MEWGQNLIVEFIVQNIPNGRRGGKLNAYRTYDIWNLYGDARNKSYHIFGVRITWS